jgi:hypothetical protein
LKHRGVSCVMAEHTHVSYCNLSKHSLQQITEGKQNRISLTIFHFHDLS